MTGETLSHYRLIERIGEGATSVVYKAQDLALGRAVAIKLLPPGRPVDFGVLARFQHEARTTSSLTHPNICTIYEIGEHEGRHFIVMEFLEGQVLSKLIGGRPLDAYRLLEIAIQIADGLAAAHAEGVVHQDIKPANIYITHHDHAKLLDFGLAVLIPAGGAEPSTASSLWLAGTGGTAPYMSPEQTFGEQLDRRSDLFSFGITLYEMATGRRPFGGGTTAVLMEAIRTQTPPRVRELNPSVPDELDRIVEKALEKNRKLRYQTASDMGADLRRLKRDLDSQNRIFVPAQPVASAYAVPAHPAMHAAAVIAARASRRRGLLIAAGVAAASVGAAAYASIRLTRTTEPVPSAETSVAPADTTAVDTGTARSTSATAESDPPSAPQAAPPPKPRIVKPDASPTALVAGADSAPPAPEPRAAVTASAPVRSVATRRAERGWADEQLAVARSKVALKLYDQALGTLTALVANDEPSDIVLQAYLLMASIHESRDRREDAIAAYVEMATRYPESASAPEALMRVAETVLRTRRRGKETEALRIYGDVAARYTGTPWASRALIAKAGVEERANVHQRDEVLGISVPAALVTYRTLVESYPNSAERETALWKLAQLYQRVKRYDLAAETLTELGERYPHSEHDPWYAVAEIYDKRLKVPSLARSAYARVPATSPRFEESQRRLSR